LRHAGGPRLAARALRAAAELSARDPSLTVERIAALNRLGVVLRTDGRLDEAAFCFVRALNAADAMPEPPAELYADVYHNVAGLAYARRELPQAEALIKRALEWRARADASVADIAADCGVLGAVLVAQCHTNDARSVLNAVLAAMEVTSAPCRSAGDPRSRSGAARSSDRDE
jgi:hypothetical protein